MWNTVSSSLDHSRRTFLTRGGGGGGAFAPIAPPPPAYAPVLCNRTLRTSRLSQSPSPIHYIRLVLPVLRSHFKARSRALRARFLCFPEFFCSRELLSSTCSKFTYAPVNCPDWVAKIAWLIGKKMAWLIDKKWLDWLTKISRLPGKTWSNWRHERSSRLIRNLSNCEREAWKKFRLQRDSNPWPLHCTGIAEVTGSNPAEAWIFFRLLFRNCLNCVSTAKIFHDVIYS